jgi:adenylate kinase family enzyme
VSVIFYGPPGVGKGTQAELTSMNYSMEHISTGNLLRDEIAAQSDLGRQVQDILQSGGLVGDEIVNAMVKKNSNRCSLTRPRFCSTAIPGRSSKRTSSMSFSTTSDSRSSA